MLEPNTVWDIRGGSDTKAEDSEEELRVEVGGGARWKG